MTLAPGYGGDEVWSPQALEKCFDEFVLAAAKRQILAITGLVNV